LRALKTNSYRLKAAVLAAAVLAAPIWLEAQHGREGGMGARGEHAQSELQEAKRRELAQSVHHKLNCSDCHHEAEMGGMGGGMGEVAGGN
jgi:hypothetical protein